MSADNFDYVIVGGGAAGSILASRLTEDAGVTVCVLEAGPEDTDPFIHIPAGFIKTLFNPKVSWQFKTEPTEWTGGRGIATTQGRTLGGVILASEKFIADNVHNFLRQTGPSLSPFNAWVMLKSLETLPIRVAAQTASAARVADFLAGHPQVKRVFYPGRADHPQYEIAKRQMSGGGTLVAFEVEGGKAGAFAAANALSIIGISNNLGDAKSLITHPETTTHQRLKPEQRAELGIGPGLLRLSVGLEDADDLIEDLGAALDAAAQGRRQAAE